MSPYLIWQIKTGEGTGIDISTFTNTANASLSNSTAVGNMYWKPDGTSLYINRFNGSAQIFEYSVGTPFDISTLSYVATRSVPGISIFIYTDVHMSSDGLKMFSSNHGGVQAGRIYQHTLNGAWDLSSMTYDGFYDASNEVSKRFGIDISYYT